MISAGVHPDPDHLHGSTQQNQTAARYGEISTSDSQIPPEQRVIEIKSAGSVIAEAARTESLFGKLDGGDSGCLPP